MEKSLLKQIWDAIKNGDCELIKSLIVEHPEQKEVYVPFGGATWLGYAAALGTLDTVKTLIDLGFDVNKGDKYDDRKPISDAASKGRSDVVAYLLSQGAVLDTSLSVRNPLFSAISGGTAEAVSSASPEVVKLLLEAGIDSKVRYNSKTMKNMDALAFARMWGKMECARMIALWNANGDEALAKEALVEGERIAYANTEPVSEEDKYYGVRES
jgi:uncharacterized protein